MAVHISLMVLCLSEVHHGHRDVGGTMLFMVFEELHSHGFVAHDTTVPLPYVLLGLAPAGDVVHLVTSFAW